MGLFRMYASNDGESRWEEIGLDETPAWTSELATRHIVFRTDPVGMFEDWHPAPRRQFVIILSGQYEIGFSDGSKKIFSAGDARLVEDTSGKGHTTAVYGVEPVVVATIPLA